MILKKSKTPFEIFTENLPGVYNNRQQAMANPFDFPMVVFKITKLPYVVWGDLCYKVEQSKPSVSKRPYRTGFFTLKELEKNIILLQNFKRISFAKNIYTPYENSSLEVYYDPFLKIFESEYKEYELEKDEKIFNVETLLKFDLNTLEILDRGFEKSSGELVWGVKSGVFVLNKEKN